MIDFFANIPSEAASRIESLSRLMYELRENRSQLLQRYQVADEEALLEHIVDGRVAEHPAYEHYLGACSIARAREEVNAELKAALREMAGGAC